MKIKKIVSVLLSAIVILTSIFNVAFIADAQTEEKTMLHYNRGSAWQRLLQKVDSTIEANVEYTVEFDSKFVTGALGNNIFFNLYGYTSGDFSATQTAPLRYSDSYKSYTTGKAFESEEVVGATTKYTFKLSSEEVANVTEYYIGFYFAGAAAEFYLADFTLYKSNDNTKANLLKNSDANLSDSSHEDWFNDYKNNWNNTYVTFEAYNSEYFPIPTKTMFHAVRTYTSENKLVLKLDANTLTANTEYTVSFNSNFVSNALNTQNFFGVFGETSKDTNADTALRVSKVFSGHTVATLFDSEVTKGANTQYTFKLSAEEISGYTAFYVGFYLYGANDFYVGDFALYESADANKTNLLPKDDMANDMSGWCNNYSKAEDGAVLFAESEYVTYDETYFPIPTKTMLHAVRTISSENKLVLKLNANTLKADTEYTVSFNTKFISNTLNTQNFFGVFGETSKDTNADTALRVSKVFSGHTVATTFDSEVTNGASTQYTFKLTANEISGYTDFYVGFYLYGVNDFYVGDFALYESADANKTNLLPKDDMANDMSGWCNNYSKAADGAALFAESEYVTYVETYFPIPAKTMFHYSRNGTWNSVVQKLNTTLEANVEYTISFDSKFASVGSKTWFGFYGGTTLLRTSRSSGTAFSSAKTVGPTTTYTFTLSESEISGKTAFYAGWYFEEASSTKLDFYIADFVIYKSSDTSKTNLLTQDAYSSEVTAWYNDGRSLVQSTSSITAEYIAYDASYFPEPEKTMLHITTAGVNTTQTLIQQTATPVAETEYTLSFNYKFENGAFDNDLLCVGLFGYNGNTGMKWDKMLRSSKEGVGATALFDSIEFYDTTAEYTFTLSENEVEAYSKFLVGFYFVETSTMITEFYVADMVMYASDDSAKTNLLTNDEYSDSTSKWYCNYSSTTAYNAQYEPYIAAYFEYIEPIYYGDTNGDYIIDIVDLVDLGIRTFSSAEYIESGDINKDLIVDGSDLAMARSHILRTETINCDFSVMKFDALSGGADSDALILKNQILNSADTNVSGTVYYVSNTDIVDASTIAQVNNLNLKSGDAVLFKRGDVFRTEESLVAVNGVHYGAYGNGAKPQILGSLRNYADIDLWSSTDGVIWQTALDVSQVGNIVFNEGEAAGCYKFTKAQLTRDGDFWYDIENKTLYLYMNKCNPGGYFKSIEIATTSSLIFGQGNSSVYKSDISIENLTLKYAAVNGINFALSDGITVKNCEIGWMGGGLHNTGTRYGNGIELYLNAANCTISNNYIYQIYDAAITFQGPSSNFSGISITNNLIEYCSMNFEFWSSASEESSAGTITDVDFKNNILRFGGYGFGGRQRKETRDQAYIFGRHYEYSEQQLSDFNITDNIFDIANCNYIFVTASLELLNISGNTYYQQEGSYFEVVRASQTYVCDQATFEDTIATVDQTATVEWISAS